MWTNFFETISGSNYTCMRPLWDERRIAAPQIKMQLNTSYYNSSVLENSKSAKIGPCCLIIWTIVIHAVD